MAPHRSVQGPVGPGLPLRDARVLGCRERAGEEVGSSDGQRDRRDRERVLQRATNYVLGVVLFAVALCFAGISTRLPRPRLKRVVLGVGIAIFLVAAVWIATSPISLSV
jgi:hypothetical protein